MDRLTAFASLYPLYLIQHFDSALHLRGFRVFSTEPFYKPFHFSNATVLVRRLRLELCLFVFFQSFIVIVITGINR